MVPQLRKRNDKRGRLVELFKGSYAQCNLLEMKKGSVWGGHYHKLTREVFYVLEGEVIVETIDITSSIKSKKTYKQDGSFIIEPHVFHRIHVKKNTKCIVLYSHQFNELDPDIYR